MSEQLTAEKRKLILDAAQSRFARYGLSKVTMDEIAQDIGMGKASLYYYFPTKESIFQEVIGREQDHFLERIRALFQNPMSSDAKLHLYMEKRAVYLKELLNLSAINSNSFCQLKPLYSDLFKEFAHHELIMITQILKEGEAAGEFQIADISKTAEVILHMLRGLRFYYMKTKDNNSLEAQDYDLFATEMAFLTDIILYGIKNPNLK
ncbi:MAG TPA: TetR family transcriptional regulator [Firmicutes bacterium]|jgi:TetR/AcrR family transcriptional regulator|nr:TetR family transcriptional regulator [Bacillota bacterium]